MVKNPEERISIEDIKKYPYFKGFILNKALKKEYRTIITEKKINKIEEFLEE